jgi:hypothetical protein
MIGTALEYWIRRSRSNDELIAVDPPELSRAA